MTGSNLSVLLSTYSGDDPNHLDAALNSIFEQTRFPDEVVLMKDGPLTTELNAVLNQWHDRYPEEFDVYSLEENQGLGTALREGIKRCSHEFVVRMDADDIAVSTRFKRQLQFMVDHPNVDVLGGYIEEFKDDPNNPHAVREVPTTHENIAKSARIRSPVNHVTVMYRKQAVISAGNYRPVDPLEDYDLWVRMLLDGSTFANIPEVLVKCRAGKEMYERRGGWKYARTEINRQLEFFQHGFISLPRLLLNVGARSMVRLLPNTLRGYVYSKALRR